MGHGVTEYTCRMIFRRVSGLGFVISTLNNAGRPYSENSGGREIDPCEAQMVGGRGWWSLVQNTCLLNLLCAAGVVGGESEAVGPFEQTISS